MPSWELPSSGKSCLGQRARGRPVRDYGTARPDPTAQPRPEAREKFAAGPRGDPAPGGSGARRRGALSITNSQNLLKIMSIESVMHALLLLPSIFPSIQSLSRVPLKSEHGHKRMTQKELVFCAQRQR